MAQVLTTRRPGPWARSAHQQFSRPPRGDTIGRNRLAAFGSERYDAALYLKRFLAHYARVLSLVPCCQLLVIDVTAGDGWERLGPFLGLSRKTDRAMPRINPGIDGGADLV